MPGSTSADDGSVCWIIVIDIGELSPYSFSNLRAHIMIARKDQYIHTAMPSLKASLRHHGLGFVMLPPLGAGGIMFSGCPSIRPQPKIRNTLYPPVHGSVGSSDQPWPFAASPSVRPSVCLSVRSSFWTFEGKHMEGMAWNFTYCCILTFRTDQTSLGLLVLLIFVLLWLSETGQI